MVTPMSSQQKHFHTSLPMRLRVKVLLCVLPGNCRGRRPFCFLLFSLGSGRAGRPQNKQIDCLLFRTSLMSPYQNHHTFYYNISGPKRDHSRICNKIGQTPIILEKKFCYYPANHDLSKQISEYPQSFPTYLYHLVPNSMPKSPFTDQLCAISIREVINKTEHLSVLKDLSSVAPNNGAAGYSSLPENSEDVSGIATFS